MQIKCKDRNKACELCKGYGVSIRCELVPLSQLEKLTPEELAKPPKIIDVKCMACFGTGYRGGKDYGAGTEAERP